MNRRPAGQTLPLLALLLALFVYFVGAHLKLSLTGIAKIVNQREADAMILAVVNDRARALNAVAALNEGLSIARERGYAVEVALLTLEACAATIFASPHCGPALARLSRKAVPFFRNLSKLGAELARMQDEILRWGNDRPARLGEIYNLSPENLGKTQVFLFPSGPSARLPVVRKAPSAAIGLVSPVRIPPPYVLEGGFSPGAVRSALARVVKTPQILTPLLRQSAGEHVPHPDLWGITEGEISGGNLSEMEFRPRLRPVSLERALWNVVRGAYARLSVQGFDRPPDWSSKNAFLAH